MDDKADIGKDKICTRIEDTDILITNVKAVRRPTNGSTQTNSRSRLNWRNRIRLVLSPTIRRKICR